MYKKVILVGSFFSLLLSMPASGQQHTTLLQFNEHNTHVLMLGMIILGSWALLNIMVSGLLMLKAGKKLYYFFQMNLLWNIVNLGIAAYGYFDARTKPVASALAQIVVQYYQWQKILLFNAGLDVAYMAGGFYLLGKATHHSRQQERLKGYGQSVILQGAFLCIFDLTLYLVLHRQQSVLYDILSQVGPGLVAV